MRNNVLSIALATLACVAMFLVGALNSPVAAAPTCEFCCGVSCAEGCAVISSTCADGDCDTGICEYECENGGEGFDGSCVV